MGQRTAVAAAVAAAARTDAGAEGIRHVICANAVGDKQRQENGADEDLRRVGMVGASYSVSGGRRRQQRQAALSAASRVHQAAAGRVHRAGCVGLCTPRERWRTALLTQVNSLNRHACGRGPRGERVSQW